MMVTCLNNPKPNSSLPSMESVRSLINRARTDPNWFCEAVLGITPWEKQSEVLEALAENNLVAVRSGNGVGKSFISACAAIWFATTHPYSFTILSSSSWKGVEKTLFGAISKLLRNSKINLGGDLLTTEWKIDADWGIFGVSTNSPENFSGFRSELPTLVIIDEASSLEKDIADAIKGLCSNEGSKILYIGNPLYPDGEFADAFRSPEWKTIHISSLESPNIKADKVVVKGLSSKKWVEERRKEWGDDSMMWEVRVLGNFPDAGSDSLIPLAWSEAAMDNNPPEEISELVMGVDVARFGDDKTVIIIRDKHSIRHVVDRTKISLMETTGLIRSIAKEYDIVPENIYVDDGGLGGGVTDRLVELDYAINPVNFGSKADDQEKFANKRMEMYYRLKEALNPKCEMPLAIPRKFQNIAKECAWARYKFTSNGKLRLEEKAEIKKRYSRSPDYADALALTYANEYAGLGDADNFRIERL